MVFRDSKGRERNVPYKQYLIKWDRAREVSRPQAETKRFLRAYWQNDIVLEEFRIPGTKKRVDLLNVNKGIIVEVSPESSHSFNQFFHGSLAGFRAALKRDLEKEEWARFNGFSFVELTETDFPLSEAAFERQGVTL